MHAYFLWTTKEEKNEKYAGSLFDDDASAFDLLHCAAMSSLVNFQTAPHHEYIMFWKYRTLHVSTTSKNLADVCKVSIDCISCFYTCDGAYVCAFSHTEEVTHWGGAQDPRRQCILNFKG